MPAARVAAFGAVTTLVRDLEQDDPTDALLAWRGGPGKR